MINNSFDPRSVAITVLTYFPKWYQGNLQSIKHTDKIRGDLCLEFISKAVKNEYHVVVIDGKSSKTFQKELHKFSGIHIRKRLSAKRSPNRRMAFKIASEIPGVKVIISTEAEKTSLLDSVKELVLPILQNKADIVVPKREDMLFKRTYPLYMYESEVEGNKLYNQSLRLSKLLPDKEEDFDMFFGPRVFTNNPKTLALFMKRADFKIHHLHLPKNYFDPEEYSNASYFPIVQALKKKFRVMSITIPFEYPKLQKENEEIGDLQTFIDKRKAQRLSILLDLMYFLNLR